MVKDRRSLERNAENININIEPVETRYSVTRILPVRRKISADEGLYSINARQEHVKRSTSWDIRKEEKKRQYSVTRVIPIQDYSQKTIKTAKTLVRSVISDYPEHIAKDIMTKLDQLDQLKATEDEGILLDLKNIEINPLDFFTGFDAKNITSEEKQKYLGKLF